MQYPATLTGIDQYGAHYRVDMPITGPNGNTVPVRTKWVYDPGSEAPRLSSAWCNV